MRRYWPIMCLALAGCGSTGSDPVPVASLMAVMPTQTQLSEPSGGGANGWEKLIQVSGTKRPPVSEHILESATAATLSDESVREVLRSLQPMNDQLDRFRACAVSDYWLVEPESQNQGDGNHMSATRVLIKALAARGRSRILSGEVRAGVEDELGARGVAMRILNGRASLSQALVAIACLSYVNRSIACIAHDPRAHSDACQLLLAGIAIPPDIDTGMQDAIRQELQDDVLPTIAQMPDPMQNQNALAPVNGIGKQMIDLAKDCPAAFDRKETAKEIGAGCEILIDNLGRTWPRQQPLRPYLDALVKDLPIEAVRIDRAPKTDKEVAAAKQALLKVTNPIGRLVSLMVLPTFDQFTDSSFRWRADQEAVRTVLAIRLWRDMHKGAMPATLSDLSKAGFLSETPTDIYGTTLRYDPERKLIWSVGPDGRDDGGHDAPGIHVNVRDLVWSASGN